MENILEGWGYLGVFVGILATGLGFPMPEELPVVVGGLLAGTGQALWFFMLPVCIIGVIIGDSFLYLIGRFWGHKLLQHPFLREKLLPADRLQKISHNFNEYGIKILLFARLTPGVRAPIFIFAGSARIPLVRFMIADGIYAVPGVSLLFFLGYLFTDSVVNFIKYDAELIKLIIFAVVVLGIGGYFVYRYFRKPMVTGGQEEIPALVEQVSEKLDFTGKFFPPLSKHEPAAADPPVDNSQTVTDVAATIMERPKDEKIKKS
jgi:membrane protein DedA with SNARE-associated domain